MEALLTDHTPWASYESGPGWIAIGKKAQLMRSVLTAWPQVIFPHLAACGLY